MLNDSFQTLSQVSILPARACTDKVGSYCDFLFSDSEGSDYEEVLSDIEVSEDGEQYNPEAEKQTAFDKYNGDDEWVGRRVVKTFGEHGDFEGIVHGAWG